jgi:hypothetical protein
LPGFSVPAFPGIPAFLHFLFPGKNGRETWEIKSGTFYLISSSNFVGGFFNVCGWTDAVDGDGFGIKGHFQYSVQRYSSDSRNSDAIQKSKTDFLSKRNFFLSDRKTDKSAG